MQQAPDIVLVLGMHRSGTSLLAEALHRAGLAVGSELIADEPAVNARGFWEDKQVVDINERILQQLGSSWYDICELPDNWLHNDSVQALIPAAVSHIQRDYVARGTAVLKDPRMCRLLPFWLQVFESCSVSVACVLMLRTPLAVARSLFNRNRLPEDYSLLLWLLHTIEADTYSRHLTRAVISYDQLLEGGLEFFAILCKELGLSIADPADSLIQVFDKSLRHHQQRDGKTSDSLLFELSNRVYEQQLRGVASDMETDHMGIETDRHLAVKMATQILDGQAELMRMGELHAQALAVITERESQLQQRNADCEHAEAVVRKRDEELAQRNTDCEYAEAMVRQRDEELNQRNADCAYAEELVRKRDLELAQRNADFAHAEAVVRERDEQLTELHRRMKKIESSRVGRLALRWVGELDTE